MRRNYKLLIKHADISQKWQILMKIFACRIHSEKTQYDPVEFSIHFSLPFVFLPTHLLLMFR